MSVPQHAYALGSEAAKLAFLGDFYRERLKGRLGPIMGGVFTANPLKAGLAGAVGQALDTPPEGSKILQSLGVAGGAAATSAIVHPIVSAIVDAAATAAGIAPVSKAGLLLVSAIKNIPTSLAQSYGATKGRDAAVHVEKFLKNKGTRVP